MIQNFGTMLVFMLISSFTPGPGNILALNTMIKCGWSKGKNLIFGIISGYLAVQYLCSFVIFNLNTHVNNVLHIMKNIGAAYLIWLAIHILFGKNSRQTQERQASFLLGFGMQIVNIKIYFYITTLLTAYIMPAFSSLLEILLAGLFVVFVGSTATLTWAFAGLKLQHIYEKHEKIINIILAILLIYCAISIIL